MTIPFTQILANRSVVVGLLLTGTLWIGGRSAIYAQTKKVAPRKSTEQAAKFEDITLITRDGVELRCTYYPGPESKQTAAMILVHDWNENRGVFHPVALWMQNTLKMSVIAPDLRGHGGSMQARGFTEPIDRERFKGPAINAMTMDIEACKSYLKDRNNEGKLNIEQLGVLGSGFGAGLAVKWSIEDWRFPDLGRLKQGRDVKALILLSPSRSFRGSSINQELKQRGILANISSLTLVGEENTKNMSEAKRINNFFKTAWRDEADEAARFVAATTSLQSTELLKSRGTGVDRAIGTFLTRRLIQLGARFPWTDRKNPLK